jgi:hypothetical protein
MGSGIVDEERKELAALSRLGPGGIVGLWSSAAKKFTGD